jgi:hypothetical protein
MIGLCCKKPEALGSAIVNVKNGFCDLDGQVEASGIFVVLETCAGVVIGDEDGPATVSSALFFPLSV